MEETICVFDGHNDVLARSLYHPEFDFLRGTDSGHINLHKMRAGSMMGGLFAFFIPPTEEESAQKERTDAPDALPHRVPTERAQAVTTALYARLLRTCRASDGTLRVARSTQQIRAAAQEDAVSAVIHFEGAEPIGPGLEELEIYYAAGLRSLGITWSRANRFGHGVPIGFGYGPNTGPGLSNEGIELVRACNRIGIALDLSHLNERGFWDVAETTDAPLIASHSNPYALCNSPRNLTDAQLDAVKESDGLVGVNFGTVFLREDGKLDAATPLSTVLRHIDYLVRRLGIDRVGFGSDFDGTLVPNEIGGADGVPRLLDALCAAGYTRNEVKKLAGENWLRVLSLSWKEGYAL